MRHILGGGMLCSRDTDSLEFAAIAFGG